MTWDVSITHTRSSKESWDSISDTNTSDICSRDPDSTNKLVTFYDHTCVCVRRRLSSKARENDGVPRMGVWQRCVAVTGCG